MPRTSTLLLSLVVVTGVPVVSAMTADQENENPRATSTTRPLIMGRHHAVSSMKPQATERPRPDPRSGRQRLRRHRRRTRGPRARRSGDEWLRRGCGRAHLRCEGQESRLDQRRRSRRRVSPQSSGTRNTGNGQIPLNDSRSCPRSCPGAIDAWYTLLDRWGTMTFEQVLQPAIEIAEQGLPLTRGLASSMNQSREAAQVPDEREAVPAGHALVGRRPLQATRDAGRMLRKLIEAEKGAALERPQRCPACRARSLLQRRHRGSDGDVLRRAGRAVPLRRLRVVRRPDRRAGAIQLPRIRRLQESVGQSGPDRALRAEHPRRLRSEEDGAEHRRLHPHDRRSA